jgi:hypothetical protein
MRGAPILPDLVITSLIATAGGVQMVIQNQGAGPVVDEFWIDFYVNPSPPPAAANETWDDGRASQGIAWAITNLHDDPASHPLPLLPGRAITVTFGDAYMVDDYTRIALPLAPGTPVYAQVDSANALTDYGGVLEIHEARGGTYNNVSGPVFVAAALHAPGGGHEIRGPRGPSRAALPPR